MNSALSISTMLNFPRAIPSNRDVPNCLEGDSLAVSRNYAYDETFYRYIERGAIRSAQVIIPLVLDRLKTESVLDVGCGVGAWVAEYHNQGIIACLGVDGDYVKESSLLVSPASFVARDVGQPFDLRRRFDLAQCLEVGEHLEPLASKTLVANLVRHSDRVLFSAAVPGQGGENHINEQPYEFWRALFAEHEYIPYDFLRPLLRGTTAVEIWYRHNIMLYVAKRSQAQLLPAVARTHVPVKEPIADVSSLAYRMRKSILSVLPASMLTRLAIVKHRLLLLTRVPIGRRLR
jgi:SAM-dependent methyltransferase